MKKTIITRLSRYRNALIRFRKLGLTKIFSVNLAEAVGVSSSLVRKDFAVFGITGVKKAGYLIEELLSEMNRILGRDKEKKFIIVGMGNIGNALIGYRRFTGEYINIVAGFDIDSLKIQKKSKVPVLPLEELSDFVRINSIELGIIAVPYIAAQQVLELMLSSGIKGVINFAPVTLKIPAGYKKCIVDYVNLEAVFDNLAFFVNLNNKNNDNY